MYSRTFIRDMQNMIKYQNINKQVIRLKIDKNKNCKCTNTGLLLISELFGVIIMFPTINPNKNQLEDFRAGILNIIRKIDNY